LTGAVIWLMLIKTERNYNQGQHKNLNNQTRKLLISVRTRDLQKSFFSFESNLESNRPYTTQAVTQPNGLQAYRTQPITLTANI